MAVFYNNSCVVFDVGKYIYVYIKYANEIFARVL